MRADDWGPADDPPRPRPARTWADKFAEALRGIRQGVRGESSFAVHFFFATVAVAAAFLLGCDAVEWALVVLCVGLVLTAELLNTALETLFHGLDADTKGRLVGVLDIAAGAVLVASLTAVAVGGLVFVRRWLAG